MDNIRFIEAEWWWGVSINYVDEGTFGMVELQYDNDMPYTSFVKSLIVPPRERRKGIATKLLDECIARARKDGKLYMQLDVEKDKPWLVSWYSKKGFKTYSIEDHVYKMILSL